MITVRVRQRVLWLSLIDAVIISAAVVMAYLLRFDFEVEPKYFALIPYVIFMHLLLLFPAFSWVKLYKRIWQYASVGELMIILKAVTAAELTFFLTHTLLQRMFPDFVVPRSIYLITWMLIVLGIGGSRFVWRVFRDNYLKMSPHHKRTLIVGAGNAGALIVKELKHTETPFYPVAFVDDDEKKQGLELLGIPVIGTLEQIPDVVKRRKIEQIIIAMPSAPRERIAEVIEICKSTKASIKILPRVADLIEGKVALKMIRDVQVEDLLGREPVEVDLRGIADYVTGKVVLVTGAGGSIGSELCRQIAPFSPAMLLLLGHGENSIYEIELELKKDYPDLRIEPLIADIQDRQRMEEIFREFAPGVVFHAAAHKHVPLMERNPNEAVKNNVFGTRNVALSAHQYGATHFVMISTDKAVNPTSVMGATKRLAEMYVQALDKVSETKFVSVRFGNVLGSRGSVIPLFKRQIEQGGPVTVTHPEMVRYFMTIPEAVQLVIQAGALANGGEVFILDMGKPVKIVDLARDLIRLSGLEPEKDIQIVFTGIRPGEKLYEEFLTAEEGTTATKHNRIFVGKPSNVTLDEVTFWLRKLEQVLEGSKGADNGLEVRRLLKQAVPTYQWVADEEVAVSVEK
jgi:FlaA1/EpsC-like NDP-sugar epimerase